MARGLWWRRDRHRERELAGRYRVGEEEEEGFYIESTREKERDTWSRHLAKKLLSLSLHPSSSSWASGGGGGQQVRKGKAAAAAAEA